MIWDLKWSGGKRRSARCAKETRGASTGEKARKVVSWRAPGWHGAAGASHDVLRRRLCASAARHLYRQPPQQQQTSSASISRASLSLSLRAALIMAEDTPRKPSRSDSISQNSDTSQTAQEYVTACARGPRGLRLLC